MRAAQTEEMAREQRDVVDAIDERRYAEHDAAQSVPEVGAKPSFAHELGRVVVRRRDRTEIAPRVARRPDRPKDAGLDRAEQLRLQRKRQSADLVEERGTAIRLAKEAQRFADRAGVCALARGRTARPRTSSRRVRTR